MAADLRLVARDRLAQRITGGLSRTSTMPCFSWGISATRCNIGSVLAKKEGSICSECCSLKGRYNFANVQAKMEQRYQGLFDRLWTPSMVHMITWFSERYFRWFDSGDVQGESHFRNICRVARETPHIAHWMPTKEAAVVRASKREIPENLFVRLSATMIEGNPPRWPTVSTVYSETPPADAHVCPSKEKGGPCGTCRACWSEELNVACRLH